MRRPFLVVRDVFADRERPDLDALGRIEDPESFVWAVLPHAARTFSACIALLPTRAALPAAVAYLYCRMLDTYEDLVPDRADREESLRAFAGRLDVAASAGEIPPAPSIGATTAADARDRAHLLLVTRAHLVDQVFVTFDEPTRDVVRDLVRDMSEGMRWSSATFDAQGGVLRGEAQLATYCRHVLGNPVVFTVRLLRLGLGEPTVLSPAEREDAMRVGELVQLANVTRDIEKDLRRGVAYDDSLRGDLGPAATLGAAAAARVRTVRERMLRMALLRAPSYGRMIQSMRLRRFSLARASAVVMLLFTERYFRGCARRVGWPSWNGPDATAALLLRGFPATLSRGFTASVVSRVEREFVAAAGGSRP